MSPVYYGPSNASALLLDDVYVFVQQPQAVIPGAANLFNGGCVGGASWGPLNTPQAASSPQSLMSLWGPPIGSGFDIVQEGSLFLKQQPIGSVIAVRVSDGTDLKAVGSFQSLNISGKYTGTFGNTIQVLLLAGSLSTVSTPTWRVVITPGLGTSEVFDNIAQSSTPATTWANIIAAINTGQSPTRPASNFITLALTGAGGSQPTALSSAVQLAGGTNGTSGITTTIEIGVNGGAGSNTGLYALTGQDLDQVWLCGNRDYANAGPLLITFAQTNLCTSQTSVPTGLSPSTIISDKTAAGLFSPYLIFNGDDVVFLDSYLNNYYSVPQSCVVAGVCCAQAPQSSPGNKQVYGILSTARAYANLQPFANSDLGSLEAAGVMILTNPIPAGSVWGTRHGKNSEGANNFATSEIPYSRMTNFLAASFSGPVMGQFVNQTQTNATNDPTREQVTTALNGFLGPMQDNNEIAAFSVTCNTSNNPPSQVAAGILQADVIVQYLAVIDKFIINLTGGQTVTVSSAGPTAISTLGGG